MNRVASFAYGLVSYALFLAVFLYTIGFVGNLVVPKTIDSGATGPVGLAVLVNLFLIVLFGVQHSVMARPGFKTWWTKLVPVAMERSTYVLLSNILMALMFWQWRPMPGVVWQVDAPAFQYILWACFFGGILLVLYSSFLIDHFDLFGLRQVYLFLQRKNYTHPLFASPLLYRIVRHPLLLGWMIMFWATPAMTQGHLLFAIAATAYMLIAIPLEEKDLARSLGQDYLRYRARTPMVLPWPRRLRPTSLSEETVPESRVR